MLRKLVKDGSVAVIISPGYGAGWSTWGDEKHSDAMLFCPELAKAIEAQAPVATLVEIANRLFPDQYTGGLAEAVVVWVPLGTQFVLDEYDGSESIAYRDQINWRTA